MAGQKMLKFTKVERDMPEKRGASERREDFNEIYAEFAMRKAEEQASRCSQCGVPYCQSHCPLHNNIPDWLRLTAEGRLQEAYEVSQATNTFPEICGRICPQDRLCEGNCVIEQSGHGTVTIGAVENTSRTLLGKMDGSNLSSPAKNAQNQSALSVLAPVVWPRQTCSAVRAFRSRSMIAMTAQVVC